MEGLQNPMAQLRLDWGCFGGFYGNLGTSASQTSCRVQEFGGLVIPPAAGDVVQDLPLQSVPLIAMKSAMASCKNQAERCFNIVKPYIHMCVAQSGSTRQLLPLISQGSLSLLFFTAKCQHLSHYSGASRSEELCSYEKAASFS